MNLLFSLIDRRRKAIIVLFSLLVALGGLMFFGLDINYNMTDYLPERANSTKALAIMQREFSEPIPNANIMVSGVSIAEALEYKAALAALPDVQDVIWLDDAVNIREPLQTQDKKTIEAYYRGDKALFMVAVRDGYEKEAMASIRELIGDQGQVSGAAAESETIQLAAMKESGRAALFVIPIIILILALATTSWVEPFIYLLTIAAAVAINLGADFFRGEISFVTLAVVPILQLAVSIDYAIFLSHRFNAIRRTEPDIGVAMRRAMRESFRAIAASAAATLFGFVGLLFMQFKIGPDMGIGLVRGILISFICVMTLLPALTLLANKVIDKTRHKRLVPSFRRIGDAVIKVKIPFFLLIMLIVVPCYLAQTHNQFIYGASDPRQLNQEAAAIEEQFGQSNTLVLLVPRGHSTKETLLGRELLAMEHVKSVISYATMVSNKIPAAFLSPDVVERFYSQDYARIIIETDTAYEGETAFAVVGGVRTAAAAYYDDETLLCGYSPNLYDMKLFVTQDDIKVEMISLVAIFLVLLITFRSLLLPLLMLVTIKASIWINMAIPYFAGGTISYIGYIVISTIQLAATVDYAILLTDYYLQYRRTVDKIEAMKQTLTGMVQAILVSGLILAIAGLCLWRISTNYIVSELGLLLGRGTLITLVMVVVFLPALLLMADKLIPYTTWKARFYRGAAARQIDTSDN
ncbi:MAG: MMPL family transporter [Clostridia bacterium]|nr:MMPL family transporter [Clostridia bacterium]